MEIPVPNETVAVPVDAGARARKRAELYVIGQSAGWGGFLVLQITFGLLLRKPEDHTNPADAIAQAAFMVFLGLLLTHLARPVITWRGWKDLHAAQLAPRVLGTALALSTIWVGAIFAFFYGVLEAPLPPKTNPVTLFALFTINGSLIFTGWLCVYFFYHLFDRFKRLEIERLRLQANVKEAELRALKSQINPHFIFNSLNSLRALIDENPTRARSAVTQLANLLRYSLQSGQLETVALEDELRVVKDYLALEQVRHEDRLRVRFDVAPEATAMNVPPMLVQTLVENAVKYGIAPRRDGGEIVIQARADRAGLRLRVSNPGSLNRSQTQGSTAMGLKNAAERLQLLFGEQARLTLREESADLVVAEVEVPLATRRIEPPPPPAGGTSPAAVRGGAASRT